MIATASNLCCCAGELLLNPRSENHISSPGKKGTSTKDIDPFSRIVSPGGFSYSRYFFNKIIRLLKFKQSFFDLQHANMLHYRIAERRTTTVLT